MFNIIFSEGIKNIDKNKLITYMSVILFTLLFLLQGYTYSYHSVEQMFKNVTDRYSVQNYKIFNLGCHGVSPRQAQKLNPENIELETAEFYEDIENSKYLKYVGVHSGGMIIENFKGDIETFAEYQWEDGRFMVYTLHVTPNFHKLEEYRVIEGRDFTDEDMFFVEDKPRAVLLGYKYRDVYSIGDILHQASGHDYRVTQLEVIGFLSEDTTVISRSGDEIYDLDNYIVYPEYSIPINEWANYREEIVKESINRDETYLFGQVKFLIDPSFEEEGKAELQDAINKYSGFSKYYVVLDQQQAMQKMQSRTESVAEFGASLTVILMCFSIVTVVFTVINRVENNLKDYAIHIAIGATPNNAIMFIISEMAIILSCSMILGMVAVNRMMAHINMPFYFGIFSGLFLLTSLIIILISALTAKLALRKHDLCTMIK